MLAAFKQRDDHDLRTLLGAKPTNQALSFIVRPSAVPFSTSFEASCDVPVFPQTSQAWNASARTGTAAVHDCVHAVDYFQTLSMLRSALRAASLIP